MNEAIAGKALGLTAVRGKLLTVKEVAALIRTSERWIQQHMNNGTFPVQWFFIGERDRVIDSIDLDIWLSKIKMEAGMASLPMKAKRKLRREGKGVAMK